jgi:hypothetical protein
MHSWTISLVLLVTVNQGYSDPPVAAETLASLRGGMSGRSAWKGLENGQKRKTSGQTSGHARKFRQSPEEPWFTLYLEEWGGAMASLGTICQDVLGLCILPDEPIIALLASKEAERRRFAHV